MFQLQMHWLGLRGSPPERYTVHHNKLIRTREPGFVVQGFLWCEKKSKTQLAPEHKRVFPLDGSWPDAETAKIVSVLSCTTAAGCSGLMHCGLLQLHKQLL